MSELEKAIEQLILKGYTSDDIQVALFDMIEDARKEPKITGSLDEYLNTLE